MECDANRAGGAKAAIRLALLGAIPIMVRGAMYMVYMPESTELEYAAGAGASSAADLGGNEQRNEDLDAKGQEAEPSGSDAL
jgi:hypothetical protein